MSDSSPGRSAGVGQPSPSDPAGADEPRPVDPDSAVGPRIVAGLIDLAIWALAWGLVAAATGGTYAEGGRIGFVVTGTPHWVLVAASLGYYLVFEGVGGQTLGKMAVGVKVVDRDGRRAGWGAIAGRTALRLVDGVVFYLVGLLVMVVTRRKQRLGDLVAKTVVVRTRDHDAATRPRPPAADSGQAAAGHAREGVVLVSVVLGFLLVVGGVVFAVEQFGVGDPVPGTTDPVSGSNRSTSTPTTSSAA